jgi:GDP/UDP-N,N'-diacetylbacillosamine 2-epimerase (hydrolysing)
MHRVAVCTFSRAEYGLLKQVIRHAAERFDTSLVVGGWHHAGSQGNTIEEIFADTPLSRDKILEVPFGDISVRRSFAAAVAQGVSAMDALFTSKRFDAVVVMGDRHELFAATLAALHHRLPVVHLSGGEVSAGAIDDSVRHATTKLSHLHLVANRLCAENVSRMGEEDWRIVVTGEPGIDNIHAEDFASQDELKDLYGISSTAPLILATLHPSTLETGISIHEQYEPLHEALSTLQGHQVFITAPGAEEGAAEMVAAWHHLSKMHGHIRFIPHFGSRNYLGMMRCATVVVGNSSSGLTEAPSLNIPVVNIGGRQQGRMAAKTILHCGYHTEEILHAINEASTSGHRERCKVALNPYDPYRDGRNSLRVTEAIARLLDLGHAAILQKKFNTDIHTEQWDTLLR